MRRLLLALALILSITKISFSQSVHHERICTDVPNLDKLAVLNSTKWKRSVLRVKFSGGTPILRAQVKKYVLEWEKACNIKFDFITKGTAEIRVLFNNKGRTLSLLGNMSQKYSINPDNLRTYASKDGPSMVFGWFDEHTSEIDFRSTILHEFGHALGCLHEHQSPAAGIPWNKPVVYEYYMKYNGWTKAEVDANIFNRYGRGVSNSAYDKKSIMLYSIPAYFLTDPSFAVGWNTELSDTDIAFIGQTYPKGTKPVTQTSSKPAVQHEPAQTQGTAGGNHGQ